MGVAARRAFALIVALTVFAPTLSGCGVKGPVYVDRGASYEKQAVLAILAQADSSAFAARPTSDGSKLRHSALAALRRRGGTASGVADMLTKTFPSDTNSAPIYVERARYDGQPAVIVVEAAGPPSGTLSSKRLWVVSDSGDVLFAGSL